MSAMRLFSVGWGLIALAVFISVGLPLALAFAGAGFLIMAAVEADYD